MKQILLLTTLSLCLLSTKNFAQTIPDSLRVDWSHAGYDGTIPDPELILNVKDFGAYGDSLHDDAAAIMKAINSTTTLKVIFFPAGKYLIKSSITLPDNTVLRGSGISTVLCFNLTQSSGKKCITASGNFGQGFVAAQSGFTKGSINLQLANTSGFIAGNYAELREDNGEWDTISPGTYRVGQILKIISVTANRITFSPALRIDYSAALHPQVRPATPKQNVGIECLKIMRLDPPSPNDANTIEFSHVNNGWIVGVESYKCQQTHFALLCCSHITISGCYAHDAFDFGGGGEAYGVNMVDHTCDCKVENCIFNHLRHSMVAMCGANGNVYAYNYSLDPQSTTEVPRDNIGDIDLHGHYPFANLFEGNIAQNIFIDDYWGPSGPYNTFFRNRAELYGIEIQNQYHYHILSDRQNVVGNEVTNTSFGKGNFSLAGSNHFNYGNNIKNIIKPTQTNTLNEISYYLSAQPYFWNISSPWSSIGIPSTLNSGTNPAKERYQNGGELTSCTKEQKKLTVIVSADSITCSGNKTNITVSASGGKQPYNGMGTFKRAKGNYRFIVSDAAGAKDTGYIIIGEPEELTVKAAKVNASFCKDDGAITVNAKGGTSPFQYALNSSVFGASKTFSNLAAAIFTAYAKDINGCIGLVEGVKIVKADALIITANTTGVTCKNAEDGTITVMQAGGSAPYLYSIDSVHFFTANSFTDLHAGSYKVWVKDSRGCSSNISVRIKNSTDDCFSSKNFSENKTENENEFFIVNISPNPSSGRFHLEIMCKDKSAVSLAVTDVYGRNKLLIKNNLLREYDFGNDLTAGIYFVKISVGNYSRSFKIVKE